jgi:7-dehydrocholesterol reductase
MPIPNDSEAWKMIFSYMVFELFLMRFMPGKEFKATKTASGHVPIYKANGMQCYLATIITLFALRFSGEFKKFYSRTECSTLLTSSCPSEHFSIE